MLSGKFVRIGKRLSTIHMNYTASFRIRVVAVHIGDNGFRVFESYCLTT
jgi:hypothetical protein